MKNPFKRHSLEFAFLAGMLMLAILIGCASPNPNFNPNVPISSTNQPNIPNTTVTKVVDTGSQVAPLVPPPYNGIVIAGLGLATAIAGIFAKVKNDQAAASAATTNQLAASVAAQGPTVSQQVLDHAANNEAVYPSVADAVNKKTVV